MNAQAIPDIDHPTPAHLLESVRQAMHDAAKAQGQAVPQWVLSAVREGAQRAFSEHDAGRVRA